MHEEDAAKLTRSAVYDRAGSATQYSPGFRGSKSTGKEKQQQRLAPGQTD
jgi:hypothetical protein